MKYLELKEVIRTNETSLCDQVNQAIRRLIEAQKTYPQLILKVIESGNLSRQIDTAYQELLQDPTTSPQTRLASAAGAYFLNENIIGGSREASTLEYTNSLGPTTVPDWSVRTKKLKLAPGIGFVEAPPPYKALINQGVNQPDLSINYTAPFGTLDTRRGIKKIMDSKIDPEDSFFPENGVFLTEGATEGVDLFMEALVNLKPKSRVVFLGLSYYTGPFAAIQRDLSLDRLLANPLSSIGETKFFPSGDDVKRSLALDTSALIITSPNNPNGEMYADKDILQILQVARERDILILFDCLFETMQFDTQQNSSSRFLQIAQEVGALDRIVVVDGLSKSKNFPGERIGWLATTNQDFIAALTPLVLSRRCNPRLTAGPLIIFEGLARQTQALQAQDDNTPLSRIIAKVMQAGTYPFSQETFTQMYAQWNLWDKQTLKFYQDNLTLTKAVLDGSITGWSPDSAAFNTFVKPSGLEAGTNSIDFLAKLMFTLATYTQVGPCFGLSQKIWDNRLGVWSRITYASSRSELIEGIIRLITFSRFYAERNFGNPNKFPALNISYDTQV